MLLESQTLLFFKVFTILFHIFHHFENVCVRLCKLSVLWFSWSTTQRTINSYVLICSCTNDPKLSSICNLNQKTLLRRLWWLCIGWLDTLPERFEYLLPNFLPLKIELNLHLFKLLVFFIIVEKLACLRLKCTSEIKMLSCLKSSFIRIHLTLISCFFLSPFRG